MKMILMDDYNGNIPTQHDVIGTVMKNFGIDAFRNGWKIILVYED